MKGVYKELEPIVTTTLVFKQEGDNGNIIPVLEMEGAIQIIETKVYKANHTPKEFMQFLGGLFWENVESVTYVPLDEEEEEEECEEEEDLTHPDGYYADGNNLVTIEEKFEDLESQLDYFKEDLESFKAYFNAK